MKFFAKVIDDLDRIAFNRYNWSIEIYKGISPSSIITSFNRYNWSIEIRKICVRELEEINLTDTIGVLKFNFLKSLALLTAFNRYNWSIEITFTGLKN